MSAVLLSFVSLVIIFKFTEFLRDKVMRCLGATEELWDETAKDAENDVLGLACSFLSMQALRFQLAGHLPNVEGAMLGDPSELAPEIKGLFLLIFIWVFVARVFLTRPQHKTGRFMEMMQSTTYMSVSWTLMFFAKASLRATGWFYNNDDESVLAEMALSFAMSFVLFAIIKILDCIQDQKWTGQITDTVILNIIFAMALCIGFCWEKCFDGAVENLAERVNDFTPGDWQAPWAKLLGALAICWLVVPAYRRHILPQVFKTGDDKKVLDENKWQEQMFDKATENYANKFSLPPDDVTLQMLEQTGHTFEDWAERSEMLPGPVGHGYEPPETVP